MIHHVFVLVSAHLALSRDDYERFPVFNVHLEESTSLAEKLAAERNRASRKRIQALESEELGESEAWLSAFGAQNLAIEKLTEIAQQHVNARAHIAYAAERADVARTSRRSSKRAAVRSTLRRIPTEADLAADHDQPSFLQVRSSFKIAGDTNPAPYPVVNLNIDEPIYGPLDEDTENLRYQMDDMELQALETRIAQRRKSNEVLMSSEFDRLVKLGHMISPSISFSLPTIPRKHVSLHIGRWDRTKRKHAAKERKAQDIKHGNRARAGLRGAEGKGTSMPKGTTYAQHLPRMHVAASKWFWPFSLFTSKSSAWSISWICACFGAIIFCALLAFKLGDEDERTMGTSHSA